MLDQNARNDRKVTGSLAGHPPTLDHWQVVMEDWERSGLSKAAYCRERKIAPCKFYYWAKKLRSVRVNKGSGFVRVETPDVSGLRFRIGNGLEVELDPGFDEDTLRRFLHVAGSVC